MIAPGGMVIVLVALAVINIALLPFMWPLVQNGTIDLHSTFATSEKLLGTAAVVYLVRWWVFG